MVRTPDLRLELELTTVLKSYNDKTLLNCSTSMSEHVVLYRKSIAKMSVTHNQQ